MFKRLGKSTIAKGLGILLAIVLVASGAWYGASKVAEAHNARLIIAPRGVLAAGIADYTCDGTQDYVQFNTAIAALPASGGKISVYGGQYNWTTALTTVNVPANVMIEGMGLATSFTGDGVTSIFASTGDNTSYKSFRVDSNINLGGTSGTTLENILQSTGYVAYYSHTGSAGFNNLEVASLTNAGLTSGRIPITGVGGLLGDNALLRWASNSLVTTTANITNLNAPTGRTATYIVVASNAPAHIKAQADYVCDGTADDVEIQAAIDACVASSTRGSISLFGTFEASAQVNAASNVDVYGNDSIINVTINTGDKAVYFNNIINSHWKDLTVYRKGTGNISAQCCYITGSQTDSTLVLENCKFINSVVSTYVGEGKLNGIFIGQYVSASPTLIGCVGQGSVTSPSAYLCDGIDIHVLFDPTTNTLGSPKLIRCTGISGNGGWASGIAITEANKAELIDCVAIGSPGKDGFSINDCSPTLKGCKGTAGENTTYGTPSGFFLHCGGSPILLNCEGISSKASPASLSLSIINASSPVIDSFYGHPPEEGFQWYYDDANDGRYQPFGTVAYGVKTASIWVSVAQPGKTVNIGTSIGGNEIAQNINIASTGRVPFAWTPTIVSAGGYIYVTPSGAIPDGSIFLYYTVVYAITSSRNALVDTYGTARISNSYFTGCSPDGYCIPMNIGAISAANLNWTISNTTFEPLCTTIGRVLYAEASATNLPVYGCTFVGRYLGTNVATFAKGSRNQGTVDGNRMSSSGNATVTSGTTSIAVNHYLAYRPPLNIQISCTGWGNATKCWYGNLTSTQFTIYVDTDPGTTSANFTWSATSAEQY